MSQKNKTVIIIAGPTAVGKTAIGIAVAKHLQTEIISADSRQCFKELNIGVARPSAEELAEVQHHFIASHSIHQKVTAATFEAFALAKATELFKKHDHVVMVGGTGLYIKAFTEGMDTIPDVPEVLHAEVVDAYRENGLEWLQHQVKLLDPLFYEKGEIHNPQRMMRALEIVKATGQSILSFRTGEKKRRDFETVRIALDLPREQLYQRINHRVDLMMEHGLQEEVRALLPYQHLNALQTVGYRELFDFFNGETTLHDAVEAIRLNTRRYAKRQLTWFRKDREYQWFPPDATTVINALPH
ncbi:tRNA (adenosine(37)-N6)-dimethylallyltransferase MiaA [Flavisolibacter nicotianae]|uniref:tRNA (adenosine(37)-N6)-dimethylallyltransferase MiaA n=1 Tax=Flavisolibacter nicotianae TaxID=2364882 RepID=UPI000EB48384|nr:tRNA (adenosine(37)-N6)-dimethylallyltransferase MiaA [Flavisolibacter nicotianae]